MDIHAQYAALIPHLPEGVRIAGVRMARSGEYEFLGRDIVRAVPRSASQVVVVPDKGYSFHLKIETNTFMPFKSSPALTATVTFDVSKREHAEFVEKLAEHPSFVAVSTSMAPPVQKALEGSALEIVKEPAA